MNKNLLSFIILFISISIYSQDTIISFENTLKTSKPPIINIIPIVNESNGNTLLFLLDSKSVYTYLFNSDFDKIDELVSDKKERKYNKLIGHSISNEDNYTFYLTDSDNDKFAAIKFSFKKRTSVYSELNLKLKGEKFLETIVYNNKFYLLSITKKTSIINIYSFDDLSNHTKFSVDLSNEKFVNRNWREVSLYDVFTENTGMYKFVDLIKIDQNSPNSIDASSEKNKLYLKEKESKIIFTFDNNQEYTQILTIDIESLSYELKRMKKPFSGIKDTKQTNSYLNEENYYALASTDEKFTFQIQNYETGELIKAYSATVNETIPFKNSTIIQQGGWFKEQDDYREFDKTKTYLRKITNGTLGISVYKLKGDYQIVLGGKDDNKNKFYSGGGNAWVGTSTPVVVNGGISISINFSTTYVAYGSYSNSRSTYINCLFDKDFNHIEGDFGENVFDKINNYKDEIYQFNNPINVETVFKYKDYYVFGYYINEKLNLLKFTDKNESKSISEMVQIIRDCAGTYIRINEKDYQVCNEEIFREIEVESIINVDYRAVESCPVEEGVARCMLYHETEGNVEVLSFSSRN